MTRNPQRKFTIFCVALSLMLTAALSLPVVRGRAQSGALIPSTKSSPDDSILSLPVMKVDVEIDNQHAHIRVLQIFDNHTSQVLEGKYKFALPTKGSIADFAVWDGDLRLPGVILEKRRANQLYEQIKAQVTDPGLLQQDDEHGGASAFSAKVFPIPAYGTKRVELEYTEMLPVENLVSRFSFPLKPSFGAAQRVGEFQMRVSVANDAPISPLRFSSPAYAMKTIRQSANEQQYEFAANNIELKEDFSLEYTINVEQSVLTFITHRAPERITAYDLRDPSLAVKNPDGYFEARAIFNQRYGAVATGLPPRATSFCCWTLRFQCTAKNLRARSKPLISSCTACSRKIISTWLCLMTISRRCRQRRCQPRLKTLNGL